MLSEGLYIITLICCRAGSVAGPVTTVPGHVGLVTENTSGSVETFVGPGCEGGQSGDLPVRSCPRHLYEANPSVFEP